LSGRSIHGAKSANPGTGHPAGLRLFRKRKGGETTTIAPDVAQANFRPIAKSYGPTNRYGLVGP